ncbi:MAG: hypothetical protein Kow0092_00850 [Deferrisomatales bacterium]
MATVACAIFRRELEAVAPELAHGATWIPAGLHTNLDRLKKAVEGADPAVCLYGMCHPDMDELVAAHNGCRLPGKDCIAAFLADDERRELESRAFVMTSGWLRHWREMFQEYRGWDEVDARQNFGFYDSIILLDFGLEPIDDTEVLEFFEYTRMPVEVVEADLSRFRRLLEQIVEELRGEGRDPRKRP